MVLALINIYVESKSLDKVAEAMKAFPEVKDLFEVTGDYDLVALVETPDIASFRRFLKEKVLEIKGVNSTNTVMILYTHKRDGKLVEG